jgi:hypothetical protein
LPLEPPALSRAPALCYPPPAPQIALHFAARASTPRSPLSVAIMEGSRVPWKSPHFAHQPRPYRPFHPWQLRPLCWISRRPQIALCQPQIDHQPRPYRPLPSMAATPPQIALHFAARASTPPLYSLGRHLGRSACSMEIAAHKSSHFAHQSRPYRPFHPWQPRPLCWISRRPQIAPSVASQFFVRPRRRRNGRECHVGPVPQRVQPLLRAHDDLPLPRVYVAVCAGAGVPCGI